MEVQNKNEFALSKNILSNCESNRFETDRHVKNRDRDHPQAQLFGIESAKSEQYFKTYTESFYYTTFGLGKEQCYSNWCHICVKSQVYVTSYGCYDIQPSGKVWASSSM